MLQALLLIGAGGLMIASSVAAVGCARGIARGRIVLKPNRVLEGSFARSAAAGGFVFAIACSLLGLWAFSIEFKIVRHEWDQQQQARQAAAEIQERNANTSKIGNADNLFRAAQYDQATKAYSRILALDLYPAQRAHALNYRGVAFYHLRKYAQAQRDWERTLVVEPAHNDALHNLSWLGATRPNEKFRNGPAAIVYARQAIENAPRPDGDLFMLMAAALAQSGKYSAAIETQDKAMRLAEQRQASDWNSSRAQEQMDCYKNRRPYRWSPP